MSTPWRHASRPRKFVRDFHRQRYGNPLFPNAAGRLLRAGGRTSKRGAGPGPKRLIALALAAVAVAGALWYVFWSQALRITSFELQGASMPTEETVREALEAYADGRTMLVLPRRNILVFDEGAAMTAIEKAIFLEDVDIRKKLPGTVVVTVREKTVKAALERAGRLYALDESGFIVRELSGKEIALMGDLPPGMNAVQVPGLGAESVEVPAAPKNGPDAAKEEAAKEEEKKRSKNAWPLVLDRRDETSSKGRRDPGSQAFSAATIGIILQANARLPDIAGEAVRWFIPDDAADSVDAAMAGEWHVYLATTTPFDVQADRLALVLKEKIGPKRPELEYVDLRYNERIFYRLKNAGQ